jgi:FtsZ-binding cell division protein ZapB
MAKRSSEEDDYPVDNFDIQLENQSGEKLQFSSDDDRKALVMGLMLHSKARSLLQQNLYDEALEVLAMAEEAFSLCDRKILEAVDNVALLQIDTVWSLFMLRDIARLAVARERLKKAREGLLRSHGKNLERLRVLQGGFCPELALYVRLELLEGVVAYHSGLLDAAQHSLLSAQRKFHQVLCFCIFPIVLI